MTLASTGLLPFAEVQQRLGLTSQTYSGVRPIRVDRIMGTLDRTVDFDRDFRPRSERLAPRLRSLRKAYPNGDFPPISVYEVGGAFFVIDGHHRVALGRELGLEFIDADVVVLSTEYELSPDVDVLTLVHTQEHQRFMRESSLDVARPDARFELLRPDAYAALLETVHAFAYRRSRACGQAARTGGDRRGVVRQRVPPGRRGDPRGRAPRALLVQDRRGPVPVGRGSPPVARGDRVQCHVARRGEGSSRRVARTTDAQTVHGPEAHTASQRNDAPHRVFVCVV